MISGKSKQEFFVPNEAELFSFAKKFSALLREGDWIWLEGEMGAGKTTFVRQVLKNLGYEGVVASPTYPLLIEHELDDRKIIHIDAFRLTAETLEPWDWREWTSAIVFVEWPEKTKLPRERFRFKVSIQHSTSASDSDSGRKLVLTVAES